MLSGVTIAQLNHSRAVFNLISDSARKRVEIMSYKHQHPCRSGVHNIPGRDCSPLHVPYSIMPIMHWLEVSCLPYLVHGGEDMPVLLYAPEKAVVAV